MTHTKNNKMKTYKNWNNEEIGFAPFYQTAVKLFRISRRVDNQVFEVYEGIGFETRETCEEACDNMYNKWSK
tara:strand:- start:1561 stop:1776 length:216 start_codon:yes stop_codon:yes gene_type:complete